MTSTRDTGPQDDSPGAAGPRMRASDTERAATTSVLQDAVARGLLSHHEGGERMAAAFGARFTDELAPLTADLPPRPASSPRPAPGWRTVAIAFATQVRREVTATRAAGVRSRRFLVAVLLAVVLLGVVLSLAGMALDGLFEWSDESAVGMGAP